MTNKLTTKPSASMSKAALVRAVSDRTGVTAEDVRELLGALAAVVREAALGMPTGARIMIPGIVSLRKKLTPAKPARVGRDPRTGGPISVAAKPAKLELRPKVDKALREELAAVRPTRR